jgi:two-component system chemotaxis response regulator CheV
MLNRLQKSITDLDNQYEVGGNYFELIEFTLMRQLPNGNKLAGIYGINVVKVREVVHMPKINPLSSRVPGIAGIFELRGVPIPAVNLCRVLGDEASVVSPEQQIIVAEFSQKRAGFIVHGTNRIRRVSWEKVLPPSADSSSSITGMLLIENNEFLFILDLEKIIAQLEIQAHSDLVQQHSVRTGHDSYHAMHQIPNAPPREKVRLDAPGILLVDDSNLILNNLSRTLAHEGWRVLLAHNGSEALHVLEEAQSGHGMQGSVHAVITDLEMPKMDGITLVRSIRANPRHDKLPIYLHTSLGDTSSKEMAEKAGANGYFVKNDVVHIIETLKNHFLRLKLVS